MNTTQIRQWFTTERIEKLDLQKVEDLAGIERGTISILLSSKCSFPDTLDELAPLLKMIEKGFKRCNK